MQFKNITIFAGSYFGYSKELGHKFIQFLFSGLFRGVFASSGSALCEWAYQRHSLESAYGIATMINPEINTNNTTKQELVKFLQAVDANVIKNTGSKYNVR